MGITASSYTLFPDTISCGGEVEGILSLSAGPDIVSNPADIVMVLDCSGSMEGEPFAAMKASVKTFIDIIDESTDEKSGRQYRRRQPDCHRQLCPDCHSADRIFDKYGRPENGGQ